MEGAICRAPMLKKGDRKESLKNLKKELKEGVKEIKEGVKDIKVSISSTFYEQLLCPRSQKRKKMTDSLTVFFALLGSVGIKTVSKMLGKSTLGRTEGAGQTLA